MNKELLERNKVTLVGEIVSGFTFNHEIYGERFYQTFLSVKRKSGADDILPLLISERLMDVSRDCTGCMMMVKGQFRSFNNKRTHRLLLSVFATEVYSIENDESAEGINEIILDGFVCKDPVYRETPAGREITDILLAVNRSYGHSDYIPCIAWGRNAGYAYQFPVGSRLQVKGRIQSRKYIKKLSETESEERVAYEVSLGTFKVMQ